MAMTTNDGAQPKKRRRRRSTYPNRFEVKLTDKQLEMVTEAQEVSLRATGRKVSLSDIVRNAVEDGCAKLSAAVRGDNATSPVAGGAVSDEVLARFTDEIEETRTQVRRIGHNVNAMTKVAHTTGEVPADLREVRAQLDALQERLNGIEDAVRLSGDDDG